MPLRHARKIAPSHSQCTHSAQEEPIAHGSRNACIENPRPFQACCQILSPRIISTSIPSLLAGRTSLFLLPISIELLEKGDKIIALLLVLQTSVDHLGARNPRFWILDIFPERHFIPGNPRIFVGIGI